MLYIVATPIGNLEDMTYRAVRTLKEVDLIAAEDTRHAQILLQKYEIQNQITSFHAHSDERKIAELVGKMLGGTKVALISDAGTPGISDPGYRLIKACREAGVSVSPIPGCSAVITALCASGFPTNEFLFLGFLPQKKGRQTLLKSLIEEERTVVFYESVHRIEKTVAELKTYLGNERKIGIARELTKIYEEFLIGTADEIMEKMKGKKPKGEFVVMIGPKWF